MKILNINQVSYVVPSDSRNLIKVKKASYDQADTAMKISNTLSEEDLNLMYEEISPEQIKESIDLDETIQMINEDGD